MITKESLQNDFGWCIDHAEKRLNEMNAEPNDGSDKFYYVKRSSSLTILMEKIIKEFKTLKTLLEEEDNGEKFGYKKGDDKKWKDKFDNTLTNILGFDVKTLDNLDIKPNDES